MQLKNKNLVLLVFAAVLFLALFRIGTFLLFDVDEAVFSTATKEMVESGDWITPTYNGELRFDKPIFFYWLQALSYNVFGINEFGARFPSALAAFCAAICLYFFVRRTADETRALYSLIAFALSAYFAVYARSAVTDMVMSLFITLSLYSFYLSLEGSRRFIYGFYLFSSLAFLTKGLIGIVFPFGIAGLYLLFNGGIRELRRLFDIRAALLFLVVSAPWYAAQFAINGDEFFQQFFMKHHFKRYTDVISGHKGPFYYYILAIAAGLSPWIVFMPAGIRQAIKKRSGLLFFSLLWFSVVTVFFSFSTTKLPNYVLSALPPACIIIAAGMQDLGALRQRIAWSVIAVGALAVAGLMLYLPEILLKIGITDTGWTLLPAVILAFMSASAFYAAYSSRQMYGTLALAMFVLLTSLLTTAVPVVNQHLQGALHDFSIYAKEMSRPDERIITYNINFPSIVFYSERKVANVRGEEGLAKYLKEKRDRLAIAKIKDEALLMNAGFRLLKKEGGYVLLERD